MNKAKELLLEGLMEGDLAQTVYDTLLLDVYQPKFGDEKRTLVVAFTCFDEEPADDLVDFISKGGYEIIDCDAGTAPEENGKYLVFVEIKRNRRMYQTLNTILEDCKDLCGVTSWNFIPYTYTKKYKWAKEDFENTVPQMPHLYGASQPSEDERDRIRKRIKFLVQY